MVKRKERRKSPPQAIREMYVDTSDAGGTLIWMPMPMLRKKRRSAVLKKDQWN